MPRKNQNSTLEYARRMARILYAIEYLGRYCEVCKLDGFSAPWLMDFHHRDESTKKYEVKNKLYGGSFNTHKEELDKCMLICVSCHRTNHANADKYQEHQTLIFERLEKIREMGTGKITKNHFLTDKEMDSILQLVDEGFIMTEIAEKLHLNYGTVKSYIKRCKVEPSKIVRLDQMGRPLGGRVRISWSIVVKLLNAKYSIRGIAEKLGINRETLRAQIHDHVKCETLKNGTKRYKTIKKGELPVEEMIFDKGKLSERQVIDIVQLYKTGNYTYIQLATMFNVGATAIQGIISGKKWKKLKLKI